MENKKTAKKTASNSKKTVNKNDSSSFAPKFCNIHLKIHICDEQSIKSKLQRREEQLGYKVRRLHGIQTEEDIEKESKKANSTKDVGGISDILKKAKENISKMKTEISEQNGDFGKVTDELEINDRISMLKNRLNSSNTSPTHNNSSPIPKNTPTGIEVIINNAKKENEEFRKEYIPPTRSALGEKKLSNKKTPSKNISSKPDKSDFFEVDENIIKKNSQNSPKNALNSTTSAKNSSIQTNVKKKRNIGENELYTSEETQVLIKQAVKEVLKEVGLLKNDKPLDSSRNNNKKSGSGTKNGSFKAKKS